MYRHVPVVLSTDDCGDQRAQKANDNNLSPIFGTPRQ
jgi:hypothetical protein